MLGARPFHFDPQVGSTNDVAREWALAGAPAGFVALAEEQIAGRGRFGRFWSAPPGTSLLISVILRPRVSHARLPRLTMVGAVAVAETLSDLESGSDISVSIKWPNDVWLNGLKVAGVLPEAIWQGQTMSAVILGIGLNVRVDFKGTPLEGRATSIESAAGLAVDRAQLLAHLLQRIDYWSMRVEDPGLFEAWRSRLITLGRHITAHGEKGDLAGQAVDVDDDGTLILRADDGTIHRIVAGEVTLSG